MTVVNFNNISGINSITAESNTLNFYDSAGNTLSIGASVSGNATGLSGTPNITVGSINAASATITGNVSVAGTVTYEDTTNVDSIGVITARSGIIVNSGGIVVSGVSTFSTGLCVGSSNSTQRLTVTGDIGIYNGDGQQRIFTVKGANGTFSTLTITVNQRAYGCFVYDLKMHGFSGTYLHYAGGAYQNVGVFGHVTTIAQKSASATFTGPTYVSGHTWSITVTYASSWIHPIAEFSLAVGGNAVITEPDISMVWS